jgi:hypothetical protein
LRLWPHKASKNDPRFAKHAGTSKKENQLRLASQQSGRQIPKMPVLTPIIGITDLGFAVQLKSAFHTPARLAT